MPASFDGTNLVITLPAATPVIDVEVDLYSDWKEWFKTGTNSKYPLAFRTFGGDPLSATIAAGAYFMFQNQNGWRIRPAEESATITLNGNIAPEDPDLPITIPTIGAYTVLINGIQPVTQNVDAIIDLTATATWGYLIESGFTAEGILRILAAVAAGKASGLEGASPAFRDIADTKDRVAGTYSAGTRTITTRDGS